MKYYITQEISINQTTAKKKSHHKNTLAPTSTANDEDFPHTLKIHAYFTINIKYIVSIYNQHVQQFYFSIVFNLILSFTALYGVVVFPSLIKTTIKDRLVFLFNFKYFICFKPLQVCNFVINLLAVFSSCHMTLKHFFKIPMGKMLPCLAISLTKTSCFI